MIKTITTSINCSEDPILCGLSKTFYNEDYTIEVKPGWKNHHDEGLGYILVEINFICVLFINQNKIIEFCTDFIEQIHFDNEGTMNDSSDITWPDRTMIADTMMASMNRICRNFEMNAYERS